MTGIQCDCFLSQYPVQWLSTSVPGGGETQRTHFTIDCRFPDAIINLKGKPECAEIMLFRRYDLRDIRLCEYCRVKKSLDTRAKWDQT